MSDTILSDLRAVRDRLLIERRGLCLQIDGDGPDFDQASLALVRLQQVIDIVERTIKEEERRIELSID